MKRLKSINIFIALTAFIVVGLPQVIYAAWGSFDTSFGFQGVVIDTVTNHLPTQIALQPDGKILVTGYKLVAGKQRFFLRRYLSNGQLDTSFGDNGAAVSEAFIATNGSYVGQDIEVLANGKITVAGAGNGHPTIWRFSSAGIGDASVGIGGMKTLSAYDLVSGKTDSAAQGNALIIGVWDQAHTRLLLVRMGANGSLDSSFGFNGEVLSSNLGGHPYTVHVEMPGSKITAGGPSGDLSGFGIERWTADGQIDGTFTFANQSTDQSFPSRYVKLANGKYIMPQWWFGYVQGLPSRTRLNVLGSGGLFESSTAVETDYYANPTPQYPCPFILGQQQDGRVLIRGTSKLYRLDTNMNIESTNTCTNYTSLQGPTQAVLQSDDKMLAAGTYNGYIAIIRTLPN